MKCFFFFAKLVLASCFYLMSTRYRCLSSDCGRTINGHDSLIIKQLPYELQMEFPAVLTHRGGVSKAVADLLRPCIQNSVGPERFQKILLELHHLRHDRLELQYLLSAFRKKNGVARHFIRPTIDLFSSFEDQKSYAGYVPTSTYFRTLYTSIIETLRPKMNKHMMILDGKVLKGDHSFKFPKHMAKIEETSVFTGLYTVTNEYEEIVQQVLVPSKALSYLRYSFEKMREAYTIYGHEMPVAFFTDNVKGDKSFLEGVFESLKDQVQPVANAEVVVAEEETGYLEMPEEVEIIYINRDSERINEVIKSFLEDLKNEESKVVGFDCEWVPFCSDSKIDVMQIAYQSKVLCFIWRGCGKNFLSIYKPF